MSKPRSDIRTLELRLGVEKKENTKLYTKIEEKYAQIKDLEAKLNMAQMELSKKSQKISQATSSMFLYQSQLERLRKELDDERSSSASEIAHLNAIIAEKNSVIEKLKNEGAFEKEQETFQTGLTLDTMVFDSILDFEDKPADGQIAKSADMNFGEFQARRQSAFGAEELSGHLGGFIRTKINSRNFRSRDLVFSQTDDKETQTEFQGSFSESVSPVHTPASRKMVSQSSQANLENSVSTAATSTLESAAKSDCTQSKLFEVQLGDMTKQVGILRAELQNSMKESMQLRQDMQQKEQELQLMTNKLLKVSEESSTAFDLINDEYERALKLIKQLRKQH